MKKKNIFEECPSLKKYWDYEKNTIDPLSQTKWSKNIAFWKCEKGHSFRVQISYATRHFVCPICNGNKPSLENSLATKFPKSVKEWDYDKNIKKPTDYLAGSSKKVWWICEKGHSYEKVISKWVLSKTPCPICNGRQLTSDNNVAALYPNLLKEYDLKKNNGILLSSYHRGSEKKVWWICEKGHSYEMMIKDKARGYGCPYCSHNRMPIEESLDSLFPTIASQWHPTKNNDFLPTMAGPKSTRKVWWICEKGHEFNRRIVYRTTRDSECPICKKERIKETKINKIERDPTKMLSFVAPDIASQWHPTKNGLLTPSLVNAKSNKKVWWICEKGHSYESVISKRVIEKHGCPYCSGHKICEDNNVATLRPDLLKWWDYNNNGEHKLNEYGLNSQYKANWICPKGHRFQQKIAYRVNGKTCPVCSGQLVTEDNCLANTNPALAQEWDYDRNMPLTPSMVTGGSKKAYWWICPNGHSYKTQIVIRSNGSGCPICDREKRTSFPEQAIAYYLKKDFEVKQRSKEGKYEIDIFLPKVRVGIEYDGYYFHNSEKASIRENRKNDFLISKNIKLIRVKEDKALQETTIDKTKYGICITYRYSQKHDKLDEVINAVKDYLNNLGLKCTCSPNVQKDRIDIDSQYIEIKKSNSYGIKKPIAAKKWDYSKNGKITPLMVPYSSKKRFWFKCDRCGFEWNSALENVRNTEGCPHCIHSNSEGSNLFKDKYPSLLEEWDYDKNDNDLLLTLSPGSGKKVWWKCSECGNEWQGTIKSRTNGHGCSKCAIERIKKSKYKRIKNIETGEVFESIIEAANKYKIVTTSISSCLNGRSKTAGGYHWKFID